jgi:hypothetical protein
MCGSSSKPPPPPPPQARPAVIASIEQTAPTLDINSNSKMLGKKRKGKKAFKQTANVSGVNTPGTGGGLSIPT